jgi:aminotransferase EvaB
MSVLLVNNPSLRATLYKNELASIFQNFIERGIYIKGEEHSKFEANLALLCKREFAVAVANGTDALEIAIKAYANGSHVNVALAANAGGYGSIATINSGGQPVYIDIDTNTGQISLMNLREKFKTRKIDVLILTHLFGAVSPEYHEILEFCLNNDIRVIEDCAQAINHKGIANSGFHTIQTFSFYPTKNLGALGDGGAIVTSDPDLAATCRSLREYGWQSKYDVRRLGGKNSRLDELQAAILNFFLNLLHEESESRRIVAKRYQNEIRNPLINLFLSYDPFKVNHIYPIRIISQRRDAFKEFASKNGVELIIHYPISDGKQVGWQEVSDILPNTDIFCDEVISLPMHAYLDAPEVTRVINLVNSFK